MVSALLIRFDTAGTIIPRQHFCSQIRLLFDKLPCKLRALAELIAYDLAHSN